MRKGLTKTLMAVAVAIMAVQAMAMAPVILDIPSPVVGNAENATPANGFVYPDAIDLTKYVTDLESQPSQIIWSYEIIGTPKYRINNVDSMDTLGSDNPVNPGVKSLNNALTGGEADFDSNPLTITVRNVELTPIIGQPGTDPGGTGVISGQTQAVTLYASDETTYSSKSIWFYTTSNENDRLSPSGVEQWPRDHTGTAGYQFALLGGAMTASYGNGNQFCLTTTVSSSPTDDKVGTWKSPYSGDPNQATLELVQNSAYKIRMVMNGSQTDWMKVPFWDMTVNNDGREAHAAPPVPDDYSNYRGRNGFGANYFFLSNTGGVNAAIQTTGGKPFVMWWCPLCVSTARWNDVTESQVGYMNGPGPYAPSMVTNRNAYVEFRILQTASNAGTNCYANGVFGTICMSNLTVERFDMSLMQIVTPGMYDAATITNVTSSGNTNAHGSNITTSFAGGTLTLTPTAAGSGPTGEMLAEAGPGTSPAFDYDPVTGPSSAQNHANFPCTMDPQTLYLVSMDLSAPAQTDMDHPPAIFWIGVDTPTNELINLSWVTPVNFNHHAGPILTPTTYKAFFHSNYASNPGAGYEFVSVFRPRYMMGNNGNLGRGEDAVGALNKSGGIKIYNMKVDKVMFPGG